MVRHRSDVNPQRLVLFGQSIGGANILDVIGQGDREGIRAVILDSTFASYATIANQMLPGRVLAGRIFWMLLVRVIVKAYVQ